MQRPSYLMFMPIKEHPPIDTVELGTRKTWPGSLSLATPVLAPWPNECKSHAGRDYTRAHQHQLPQLIYLLSLSPDQPTSNRGQCCSHNGTSSFKGTNWPCDGRLTAFGQNRLIFHGSFKEHVLLTPTTLGSTCVRTVF